MRVLLKESAFDPYAELRQFEAAAFPQPGAFGATASFVGTMRDLNEGDAVSGMFLEHYPGMTERHLEAICAAAAERWTLLESGEVANELLECITLTSENGRDVLRALGCDGKPDQVWAVRRKPTTE